MARCATLSIFDKEADHNGRSRGGETWAHIVECDGCIGSSFYPSQITRGSILIHRLFRLARERGSSPFSTAHQIKKHNCRPGARARASPSAVPSACVSWQLDTLDSTLQTRLASCISYEPKEVRLAGPTALLRVLTTAAHSSFPSSRFFKLQTL